MLWTSSLSSLACRTKGHNRTKVSIGLHKTEYTRGLSLIPIGTVVTAATKVRKWSRGQGLFFVLVKQSRTLFKLGNSGQGPVCSAVKWSSNKNNSQNFFEPSHRCDYSAYDSDHALIQQNKED